LQTLGIEEKFMVLPADDWVPDTCSGIYSNTRFIFRGIKSNPAFAKRLSELPLAELTLNETQTCIMWAKGHFNKPTNPIRHSNTNVMMIKNQLETIRDTHNNVSCGAFLKSQKQKFFLDVPSKPLRWRTRTEAREGLGNRTVYFLGNSLTRQVFIRLVKFFRSQKNIIDNHFHCDASYGFNEYNDSLKVKVCFEHGWIWSKQASALLEYGDWFQEHIGSTRFIYSYFADPPKTNFEQLFRPEELPTALFVQHGYADPLFKVFRPRQTIGNKTFVDALEIDGVDLRKMYGSEPRNGEFFDVKRSQTGTLSDVHTMCGLRPDFTFSTDMFFFKFPAPDGDCTDMFNLNIGQKLLSFICDG